jgi:hypothetical protein
VHVLFATYLRQQQPRIALPQVVAAVEQDERQKARVGQRRNDNEQTRSELKWKKL